MPVSIGTVDGKADYIVITAIKNLASAVDAMDARLVTLQQEYAQVNARVSTLERQQAETTRLLQQLQRQVTALENP